MDTKQTKKQRNMYQDNELIKKVFGLLLTEDVAKTREYYGLIKPEWFRYELDQNLYSCIGDLLARNESVDILTLTMEMRDKYKANNKIAVYITECSTQISVIDRLHVGKILTYLRYSYVTTNAQLTLKNLAEVVGGDKEINFEKYLEILHQGIDTYHNEIKVDDISNEKIGNEVIDRHERAKNGECSGITLGYSNMAEDIVLEPVDLMVVGARPGMGKTSWGVDVLCRLFFHNNLPVAYFNLEMSNVQLMRRIYANLSGIDSKRIKLGECTQDEIELLQEIKNKPQMKNLHLFEGSHTIQQIQIEVNQLKYNCKLEIFIVDYLQKIISPGKARYEQVTASSNGLKYISQNMQIPCLALAQLGRDSGKSGHRPILPDLRDSGEIEQDASIVAFIHRPEYYGEEVDENGRSTAGLAEFIVAKNREGDCPICNFNVDLKTSVWREKQYSDYQMPNPWQNENNEVPF